jgi:hypothetical protein
MNGLVLRLLRRGDGARGLGLIRVGIGTLLQGPTPLGGYDPVPILVAGAELLHVLVG